MLAIRHAFQQALRAQVFTIGLPRGIKGVEAAFDLGAKPWKVFLKVILPLSLPGVLTGSMLVLIPAVGEFVIPELLGGTQTLMIGKLLWNEFFNNRDWPVASALAVLMLIFLVVPIALFQKLQERQTGESHED